MIEPKTYRKKPVHVTAKKLTDRASMLDIVEWIGENHHSHIQHPPEAYAVRIDTLEGIMTARIGDYVVRGVAGEFYPVKPKIFAATYEEIDQDGNRVNSTQYPSSDRTPVLTVPAIIEWLEGKKEDVEANQKKMGPELSKLPDKYSDRIHNQLTGSIMMVETLMEKLTKSTFEQMDEAQHD